MKCKYMGDIKNTETELVGRVYDFGDFEVIKYPDGSYEGYNMNTDAQFLRCPNGEFFDCGFDNTIEVTSEHIRSIEAEEGKSKLDKGRVQIFNLSNGINSFTVVIYDEICWLIDGTWTDSDNICDFLRKYGNVCKRPESYDHYFDLKCPEYYLGVLSDIAQDFGGWTVDDNIPNERLVYGEGFEDDSVLDLFIDECNRKGYYIA